jgi:hypothetical protein
MKSESVRVDAQLEVRSRPEQGGYRQSSCFMLSGPFIGMGGKANRTCFDRAIEPVSIWRINDL